MTKLIKTNLLKNGNTSDLAKVTASTRDYCNFKYKKSIGDMSFKDLIVSFFLALATQVTLIVLLSFKLTGGLIFWPYWMVQQFLLKRRVIREILAENNTIDEFNQFAKKIESDSKE